MKVIVLTENQATEQLCGEHGLSLYIEYRGKTYLLDTGESGLFAENACKLKLPLEEVEAGFVSHAHYDHTGGLETFFTLNRKAQVYIQEAALRGRYYKIVPEQQKSIGLPQGLAENYAGRFVAVSGDANPFPGIHLLAHRRENFSERARVACLYQQLESETEPKPDTFRHEQSVLFETDQGLVVINSCSHSGVDVVLEEVKEAFPDQTIAAVIGGFHLMGTDGVTTMAGDDKAICMLAERLRRYPGLLIYTGHCTGLPAFAILQEQLGDQVTYLSTGLTINL